jgi:prephenate dehydrogenase
MKKPIIVLGIGELGSVFARAFLKNNRPVYPITRATDIDMDIHDQRMKGRQN